MWILDGLVSNKIWWWRIWTISPRRWTWNSSNITLFLQRKTNILNPEPIPKPHSACVSKLVFLGVYSGCWNSPTDPSPPQTKINIGERKWVLNSCHLGVQDTKVSDASLFVSYFLRQYTQRKRGPSCWGEGPSWVEEVFFLTTWMKAWQYYVETIDHLLTYIYIYIYIKYIYIYKLSTCRFRCSGTLLSPYSSKTHGGGFKGA